MSNKVTVGVIANPFSSRDIRRLISSATAIQTAERANIVERVIVSLGIFGIDRVLMMPDKSGITAQLMRRLENVGHSRHVQSPRVELLDMPITGTSADSEVASAMMRDRQVAAVVVLGGDGTHRAVAKHIGDVPVVGISTGTNNAFPRFHEATVVGMAVGLYATNAISNTDVLFRNKMLEVEVKGRAKDIALVDVAVTDDKWVGARAIWRMEGLRELYLAFCEPSALGMSSIGGMIRKISRDSEDGLKLMITTPESADLSVHAPILPGVFEHIGISSLSPLQPGTLYPIETSQGVIALDGERELEFGAEDEVVVSLNRDGPLTIDVDKALELAVEIGVFRNRLTDSGDRYPSTLFDGGRRADQGDIMRHISGFSSMVTPARHSRAS